MADDLNLPNAVVTRIIKDALPDGCNVAKEAKTALAKAASVFVLYITSQANAVAIEKNRKTITNRDVLEALQITDFARFEEPLSEAMEKYKQDQQKKKERKLRREARKPGEELTEMEINDELEEYAEELLS